MSASSGGGPSGLNARPAEIIAGASGVALLILLFLDWYSVGTGNIAPGINIDFGVSAWEAFAWTDLLAALAAIGGILVFATQAAGRSPAVPVAAAVNVALFAALVSLLILYRIVNQPGPNDLVNVEPGAFLGFLACVGVAVGAFLAMRDEAPRAANAPIDVDERPVPPATAAPEAPPPAPAAPPAPTTEAPAVPDAPVETAEVQPEATPSEPDPLAARPPEVAEGDDRAPHPTESTIFRFFDERNPEKQEEEGQEPDTAPPPGRGSEPPPS